MSDLPMRHFAAESHTGNRYQHNEDSLGWSEQAGVWLVADGMGGHACGDVASQVVKRSILQAITADGEARSLSELILQAHQAVIAEGVQRSAENMGSTVALVRLQDAMAQIAWCGDSRVYLLRDKQLVRLTRDHSLLEQLLESGAVDPEDAFNHPRKNVLVQALGVTRPAPVPSEIEVRLASGDLLLLCSDGLHDEMRDEDISNVVNANPDPGAAVSELIRQVLAGSARDNLSIIALSVGVIADSADVLNPQQLRDQYDLLPVRIAADRDAAQPAAMAPAAMAPAEMKAPKIALPGSNKSGDFLAGSNWSLLISIVIAIALLFLLMWRA